MNKTTCMNYIRRLTKYFVFGLTGTLLISVAAYGETGPLSVQAKLAFAHGAPVIKYVIKNISAKEVTIDDGTLPWRSAWSAQVIFAYENSRKVIPRSGIIDDVPPPFSVTLKAGQEISGNSPLDMYLDNFKEKSQRGDIIVFWFYAAKTADQKPVGNYGGWLIIPKGTGTSAVHQ